MQSVNVLTLTFTLLTYLLDYSYSQLVICSSLEVRTYEKFWKKSHLQNLRTKYYFPMFSFCCVDRNSENLMQIGAHCLFYGIFVKC